MRSSLLAAMSSPSRLFHSARTYGELSGEINARKEERTSVDGAHPRIPG